MRPEALLSALQQLPDGAGTLGLPDGERLELRRAWPRPGGGLTLEYAARDTVVAGQWLPDAGQARALAGGMPRHAVAVAELGGHTVVLQAAGVDRRLPALAAVVAQDGARLVAHRAERRATVARPGVFVKVLPARRVGRAVAAHRWAVEHARGVVVPPVVAADEEGGTLTLQALEGPALHDVLGTAAEREAAAAVGAALRRFHATPPPPHDHHGAPEEAFVLAGWLQRLAPFARELHARVQAAAVPVLDQLRKLGPSPVATIHRDLHDKQVLLGADDGVGLIDLDTATAGDPTVDLANLLAHLRLRAVQAGRDAATADAAREALLAGYGVPPSWEARLVVHERATELRLACVYGFRPRWRGLPERLAEGLA